MTTPLLPPRGVFAATVLLFDHHLSPGLKETLLQLISLAWANPGHETPHLSYAQLSQLTGKSSSTLHGHIAALRDYRSALRLRSAGHGTFIFSLDNWLYPGRMNAGCVDPGQLDLEAGRPWRASRPAGWGKHNSENLESPVKEERIIQVKEDEEIPHPPLPPSYPPAKKSAQPKNANDLESAVDAALRKASVYTFLLPEMARTGWASADRLALLAWCQADRPERFYGERCETCGQTGGYTADCRRRYLDYLC